MLRRLLRLVIYTHRYLGIALSLLFAVWFASGIVMIYAGGMPSLTSGQRLARLPPLELAAVKLTPAEAAQRAGGRARTPTLTSVLDRPAYRFQTRAGGLTLFADTGEPLLPIDQEKAQSVAARFLAVPVEKVRYVRTLEQVDQWTMSQRSDLPLFKFRLDDDQRTQVYVSPQRAEVVQLTTLETRALAWAGTIPHWLYFSALRANQSLWYKIVVWTSGLGFGLALMGLVLAFTQFRKSKPFRLKASIPYRGWMRWHYIVGATFGILTLTWVFSGLLSMEPFEWTKAKGLEIQRDALSGGAPELDRFGLPDAAAFAEISAGQSIRELSYARIQDGHYYNVQAVATGSEAEGRRERLHEPYTTGARAEPASLLVAAATMKLRTEPFTVESLLERLRKAAPGVPIVEHELLSEYDDYYYSRGRQLPLPVLRVKFGDPAQTWYYIDPQRGQIRTQVHRFSRVERWLYNGLHSLDFSFWYGKRPWWDVGMITFLLGGLALSCTGFYLGIKRLWRDLRGAFGAISVSPPRP